MNCIDCIYYDLQGDGKPAICTKLIVANTWQGYDRLKIDGVGYSDEAWEEEFANLWVGENFGCKHIKDGKTNTDNNSRQ